MGLKSKYINFASRMLNLLRNMINNDEPSEMLTGVTFWSFKCEGWPSWLPTRFIKSQVVVKLPPEGSVHFGAWYPPGLQSLEPFLRWKQVRETKEILFDSRISLEKMFAWSFKERKKKYHFATFKQIMRKHESILFGFLELLPLVLGALRYKKEFILTCLLKV